MGPLEIDGTGKAGLATGGKTKTLFIAIARHAARVAGLSAAQKAPCGPERGRRRRNRACGVDATLAAVTRSAKPGAAAALAFYDFVALLQQPLALAVFALLLLLDVGAFVVGHESLQTSAPQWRT
jgi:hypothetical protein